MLPDYDEKKTYTHEEMQHVVAREMSKQQIVQLQNGQIDLSQKIVAQGVHVNEKLDAIFKMLERQPAALQKCRDDLKDEIKEEFPSKMDLLILENHMKDENTRTNRKIDIQWIKITVIVSTVVAIGGVIQYLFLLSKFFVSP